MKVCGVVSIGLLGLFLISIGVVFPKIFPVIMSLKLESKLLIREDSPTIGNFISPPIPIFMQYYFFNVTNSEDILEGAIPKLNQVGPFTYEEKRLKYDLVWNEASSTVTYLQNKTFFFRQDLSNGLDEDTYITTINPVLISIASKLSKRNSTFLDLMLVSLGVRFDAKPFITRKAGELLFGGYEEKLITLLAPVTKDPVHATGKFGFFYPKNDSNDGTYEVYTGASGMEYLQVIHEWRGETTLNYWSNEFCNMINGTTGSQFPHPIAPEINIRMYSADLCRSLSLKFEKKLLHGNLELYRYVLPFEALAESEENKCYCTDDFTCRSSMINLGPCKKGAPVVASTPHFYMGSTEDVLAVEGLNPSKMEHQTFLDIEPNTGVTFRAHKRIQINMPLKRYDGISQLSKVRELVLPILWLNESAEVPLDRAQVLYRKLTLPVVIVTFVCWALFAVGCVLLILSIIISIKSSTGSKSSKYTVSKYDQKSKVDIKGMFGHLFAEKDCKNLEMVQMRNSCGHNITNKSELFTEEECKNQNIEEIKRMSYVTDAVGHLFNKSDVRKLLTKP